MDEAVFKMKIFFSVGEPSGDLHGANLIRKIAKQRPDAQFVGYGGPKMQAAGCELHHDLTKLAIMWFLRALLNIRTFWNLLQQANRYFRDHRPDAVVLIDYPGFNWWIARKAKAQQIPVFYYGTPQMWAWAGWRVKKMRRLVDHVLCKLPFEVDWYGARGCDATYVGHPYFDELSGRKIDKAFVKQQQLKPGQLVTILPGSRNQEVEANLESFLKTAKLIRDRIPKTRFAIASFNQSQADRARQLLAENPLGIEVFTGKTPELIAAAYSCLACSGSVSLELLYHEKPTVIHYRIGRAAYWVQSLFRKVRFITLVNLLATEERYTDRGEIYDVATDRQKVPFPEYLTCVDRSEDMAEHVCEWLVSHAEHARVVSQLQEIKNQFLTTGASKRAADYIVQELSADENRRVSRPVAA